MSVKFSTTTWNRLWAFFAGNLSGLSDVAAARGNLDAPGLSVSNSYSGALNDFQGVRARSHIHTLPPSSIADDSVLSINTGNNAVLGGIVFFVCDQSSRPAGSVYYRSTNPSSGNSHCTVLSVVNGGLLTVSTGTPTGTTGTDGRLNIFAGQNTDAGILYFENRLGASISLSALVMQ